MTRCCICTRPCVPLADYGRPVCVRCDQDMQAVTTRAALVQDRAPGLTAAQAALADAARLETARVYARTVPEHRQPGPAVERRMLLPLAEQEPTRPPQDRRSGKGVRVCAHESRPAAGADLTSSLTIRPPERKAAGRVAHARTGSTGPAREAVQA